MKLRKTISLTLALLMLASCSNDTAKESETNDSTVIPETPEILTHVFRGEEIPLPEGYELTSSIPPLYDKETGNITCLCVNTVEVTDPADPEVINTVSEYRVVTLSSDGSTADDRLIEFEESIGNIKTGVITDDSCIFIQQIISESAGSETYSLVKYSFTDGSVTKSDSLQPLFTEGVSGAPWFYIECMAVDGDGYIYVASDAEIIVLDQNFIKSFSVFPQSVRELSTAPNGTVYASGRFDGGQGICAIDKSTEAFGEYTELGFINSFFFGDGYDLYYSDDNGLYGMNFSDTDAGNSELVMNFAASDVIPDSLTILTVINKDMFLASRPDPETQLTSLALYKESNYIDLSNLKVIEIATAIRMSDAQLAMIAQYNNDHPESRIIVTDYKQNNTDDENYNGYQKLAIDIVNGLYKPDIIVSSSYNDLEKYMVENDLYTDLYTYIDKDDRIDRDDIFGAVKNLFDDDGKLYALTNMFEVHTLIGPSSILGERTSWTFSEMIDFASALPDGVSLIEDITQKNALKTLFGAVGYASFIDTETNTPHFDSAEFIKYLEYLKTLPADIDYAALPSDYKLTANQRRYNGEIALYDVQLTDVRSWLMMRVYFNTDDYNIIGFPTTEDGYGSYVSADHSYYMMTSFCDYPDEAWEFIKSVCLPEDPQDIRFGMGLPSLKSTFDILAEKEAGYQYYFFTDIMGYQAIPYDPENPKTVKDFNEPGILAHYTEEEHAALKEFLDTKVGVPASTGTSEEITAIVDEEISVFLSGTRSAEDTADIIQSRVSIWLAEHE